MNYGSGTVTYSIQQATDVTHGWLETFCEMMSWKYDVMSDQCIFTQGTIMPSFIPDWIWNNAALGFFGTGRPNKKKRWVAICDRVPDPKLTQHAQLICKMFYAMIIKCRHSTSTKTNSNGQCSPWSVMHKFSTEQKDDRNIDFNTAQHSF